MVEETALCVVEDWATDVVDLETEVVDWAEDTCVGVLANTAVEDATLSVVEELGLEVVAVVLIVVVVEAAVL